MSGQRGPRFPCRGGGAGPTGPGLARARKRRAERQAEQRRQTRQLERIEAALAEIAAAAGRLDKGLADQGAEIEAIAARLHEIERRLPNKPIRGPRDSLDLVGMAEILAADGSARYMLGRMDAARRLPSFEDLLKFGIEAAGKPPLVLEFGVMSGRTIRILAGASPPEARIYGFDSFEGLPERWRPGYEAGIFKSRELPEVPENVTLVKGLFQDTLPGFLATLSEPVRFVHVDCDIYSSTKYVLDALRDHLADGAVLIFDEYFNYPGWEAHEFKAFQEFVAAGPFGYDYIACVPGHQQAGVRLRRIDPAA